MATTRSLSRSPTQMHYAQLYKTPYIAKAKLNYGRLARTCAAVGANSGFWESGESARQSVRCACFGCGLSALVVHSSRRVVDFPFRPLVVFSSRPPFFVWPAHVQCAAIRLVVLPFHCSSVVFLLMLYRLHECTTIGLTAISNWWTLFIII